MKKLNHIQKEFQVLFINKYGWKRIHYPSKIDDWKTFEKINPTIALNILYTKEKPICPADISEINSNCEKQIILLMIPNREKDGSCSGKIVYIIKRNKTKTLWLFLLLELSSFF